MPNARLLHNLRVSRETELMHEHPIHVVTAWLGNSPQIAMKHSCMVTEEDFKKARRGQVGALPPGGEKGGANSDARLVETAVQNPAQQPRATLRNDSHDSRANPAKSQSGGHGIRTRNRFPGI
jgi:hypothetical protein